MRSQWHVFNIYHPEFLLTWASAAQLQDTCDRLRRLGEEYDVGRINLAPLQVFLARKTRVGGQELYDQDTLDLELSLRLAREQVYDI